MAFDFITVFSAVLLAQLMIAVAQKLIHRYADPKIEELIDWFERKGRKVHEKHIKTAIKEFWE